MSSAPESLPVPAFDRIGDGGRGPADYNLFRRPAPLARPAMNHTPVIRPDRWPTSTERREQARDATGRHPY